MKDMYNFFANSLKTPCAKKKKKKKKKKKLFVADQCFL